MSIAGNICWWRLREHLKRKSYGAARAVAYLEQTVMAHSKPQYIRCDNGPELISTTMVKFGLNMGRMAGAIEIRYTQPEKPMQNGLVEQLNGTVRTECLNLTVFQTIQQVQDSLDVCGADRGVTSV